MFLRHRRRAKRHWPNPVILSVQILGSHTHGKYLFPIIRALQKTLCVRYDVFCLLYTPLKQECIVVSSNKHSRRGGSSEAGKPKQDWMKPHNAGNGQEDVIDRNTRITWHFLEPGHNGNLYIYEMHLQHRWIRQIRLDPLGAPEEGRDIDLHRDDSINSNPDLGVP